MLWGAKITPQSKKINFVYYKNDASYLIKFRSIFIQIRKKEKNVTSFYAK